MWVRIDNRLVHGQIIETWLPFTGASVLVVVDDEMAADSLRQEIMGLAVPSSVRIIFTTVDAAAGDVGGLSNNGGWPDEALVLFSSCQDARRAFEHGLEFQELNIGNLHYEPGKVQICPHVAVSNDDKACFDFFVRHGVLLDFRCVPGDDTQVRLPL